MRIIELNISNFRGIKSANIVLPDSSRMLCLIGPGDSTKSTILKAIEWILWPSWNLTVNDNDFYNQNIEQPIILTGSFTELPEQLIQEDKYGLYLRRPQIPLELDNENSIDDEPKIDKPIVLTIRLTINKDLEPKWEVVCNRIPPKIISQNDRKLFFVGNVGENYSRDLSWGRSSVLQKYENMQGALQNARTQALRAAAQNADLQEFDKINEDICSIGEEYGVSFNAEINNRFQLQNNGISSAMVSLFDGDSPLMQKGTGSQRLLSMGLNISKSDKQGILLIDEIENGLEPYRLRTLINELRSSCRDSGQIIITTHSPVAVTECNIAELLIVHSTDGCTSVITLKGSDKNINEEIQKGIRANSEAFLCKRLIVCEGKTEVGFIRSLDSYLSETQHVRLAYKGVSTADGGGSNIFSYAEVLIKCGYKVCLLMDSDKSLDEEKKRSLQDNGINVFDWDVSNAFEEQIFSDVTNDIAEQILNVAVEEKGMNTVTSKLTEGNIPFEVNKDNDKLILHDSINRTDRKTIGKIAKNKRNEWYKRIDLGESIGNIIFDNLGQIDSQSKLAVTINELISWVLNNDTERSN